MKAVDILEREITRGMRLLGVSNVKQLVPEMVGTRLDTLPRNVDLINVVQVEHVNWQPVTAKL